jgi:hypothetical protein
MTNPNRDSEVNVVFSSENAVQAQQYEVYIDRRSRARRTVFMFCLAEEGGRTRLTRLSSKNAFFGCF